MIGYKFLAKGGVGPFTGFAWPLPHPGAPGAWVMAPHPDALDKGIHACRAVDVAYWTDVELYVVELEDRILEHGIQIVANRARLLSRIDAWNEITQRAFSETCVLRTRDSVVQMLRDRGEVADAERLHHCDDNDLARIAGDLALSRPWAGYVSDAIACLQDCGATSAIAAKAAAAAHPGVAAERAERIGQGRWLAGRLGLS